MAVRRLAMPTGIWLIFAAAVFSVLWPQPLVGLHFLASAVCSQLPGHFLLMDGGGLPMDARCTGIYSAAVITIALLAARRRITATKLPPRPILVFLIAFILVMAFDGTNSTLAQFGGVAFYHPRNDLRALTGVLFGYAMASIAWPLLVDTLGLDHPLVGPPTASARQFIADLAILALWAAALILQPGFMLFPSAVLSVTGELAIFSGLVAGSLALAMGFPRSHSGVVSLVGISANSGLLLAILFATMRQAVVSPHL